MTALVEQVQRLAFLRRILATVQARSKEALQCAAPCLQEIQEAHDELVQVGGSGRGRWWARDDGRAAPHPACLPLGLGMVCPYCPACACADALLSAQAGKSAMPKPCCCPYRNPCLLQAMRGQELGGNIAERLSHLARTISDLLERGADTVEDSAKTMVGGTGGLLQGGGSGRQPCMPAPSSRAFQASATASAAA